MSKFLAYVFLISVSIGLSIFVMTVGWGLKPQSWWAIIVAGLGGQVLVRLVTQVIDKEKEGK